MAGKSVVRESDGLVINRIEIEKDSTWECPKGCVLMDGGEIGDTWGGEKFITPEPKPVEPERDLIKEIDVLTAEVEQLKTDVSDLKKG